MSYCRWSSLCEDGQESDVYAYEDVRGGYTVHVAGRKPGPDGWVDLPPPFANETFNVPTAADCADQLEALRKLGYACPQYAIDALREEALEDQLRPEPPVTSQE